MPKTSAPAANAVTPALSANNNIGAILRGRDCSVAAIGRQMASIIGALDKIAAAVGEPGADPKAAEINQIKLESDTPALADCLAALGDAAMSLPAKSADGALLEVALAHGRIAQTMTAADDVGEAASAQLKRRVAFALHSVVVLSG
jgi:hypothetical protein